MDILFIVKQRKSYGGYGGNYGLFHSALGVANALRWNEYDASVVEAVDGNSVDAIVTKYRPSIVVLEALWVTPDKLEQLAKLHKKVKWIIRLHSKVPFLANEGIALDWLFRYDQLTNKGYKVYIAGNHQGFVSPMSTLFEDEVLFLPNIYHKPYERKVEYDTSVCDKENVLNIGCFGAIRPLKNHLSQAIAAVNAANYLGKKLVYHVNAGRIEQNAENPFKNIEALFAHSNHVLVKHGWYPHKEFFDLVGKMDIGMQVSLSETFNIVTADFVYNNVPIVVSPEIEWMPFWTKTDPNDIDRMTDKLLTLLDRPFLSFLNTVWLNKYNKKAVSAWFTALENINECGV